MAQAQTSSRTGLLYFMHPLDAATGQPCQPVPQELVRLLEALFQPDDWVLIRPIETWNERGRKRSRVLFKQIRHVRAGQLAQNFRQWTLILQRGVAERANLFFGVCPRVKSSYYDLAWQIRTVRVLWADLDHCTPDLARQRCVAAGVPFPSLIVCSGHGVHLYWLLAQPLVIDDAREPPAVYKDFINQGPGQKKKVVRYFKTAGGRKVYELQSDCRSPNPDWPTLSAKAMHIQNILAGLAAAIGGDHTHDLARILRLPGTLNRKDERNGKTPIPCELVECTPERKYPLTDFERFAAPLPRQAPGAEAAKIRLPTGRKLTATRRNKLNEYINVCSIADAGDRSEPDFALCCYAIREGLDKEQIWKEVADVGKFAERGQDYFDLTWKNAEGKVRQRFYLKASRQVGTEKRAKESADVNSVGMGTPFLQDGNGVGTIDSMTSTAQGHAEAGVQEDPNDPHRLSRIWLTEKAHHPEGPRAKYYREQFWSWQLTHWLAMPDAEMRSRMAFFCKRQLDRDQLDRQAAWTGEGAPPSVPKITRELVTNVLQALGGEVLLPGEVNQPVWLAPSGPARRCCVALQNGILDIDRLLGDDHEVLLPHTPRWFSPVCLPYAFDPDADCPRWRAFLHRNLADHTGKITLLQQFAGYLLLPTTDLQRFLLMVGEGANGKSVICAVLRALLGEGNVASVPLEMFGQRFHLSETLGRLANIVAEVGELDRVAEGQLKAFVSGDPILFERKFKSPFTAQPTARLVLATNNPPQFSDKSDGLWRRMLLLRFSVQIPPSERVAGLDTVAYWAATGELPGILNWALAGLHKLRVQGRFEVPTECQEDLEKLRAEANPARRFLREHYQEGGGTTVTAEAYVSYSEWCRQSGHMALSESNFGKEVLRTFPNVIKRRVGSRGQRYHVYEGLVPGSD